VGWYQDKTTLQYITLVEYFDGTTWHLLNSPSPGGSPQLSGVSCPSAAECLAAGGKLGRTLIEKGTLPGA
jgi:hypothetical protein